jgi:UPF0716 family protein affecting phage T7 exclusion
MKPRETTLALTLAITLLSALFGVAWVVDELGEINHEMEQHEAACKAPVRRTR